MGPFWTDGFYSHHKPQFAFSYHSKLLTTAFCVVPFDYSMFWDGWGVVCLRRELVCGVCLRKALQGSLEWLSVYYAIKHKSCSHYITAPFLESTPWVWVLLIFLPSRRAGFRLGQYQRRHAKRRIAHRRLYSLYSLFWVNNAVVWKYRYNMGMLSELSVPVPSRQGPSTVLKCLQF